MALGDQDALEGRARRPVGGEVPAHARRTPEPVPEDGGTFGGRRGPGGRTDLGGPKERVAGRVRAGTPCPRQGRAAHARVTAAVARPCRGAGGLPRVPRPPALGLRASHRASPVGGGADEGGRWSERCRGSTRASGPPGWRIRPTGHPRPEPLTPRSHLVGCTS